MSLLPFWVLKVVILFMSMGGLKALGFHLKKNLHLCSEEQVLQVWNNMRVSNYSNDRNKIVV